MSQNLGVVGCTRSDVTARVLPHFNLQNTRELNLTVLQRIDPYVEDILTTAAHVTLYQLNTITTEWSKKDVEGSLFVVKRRAQPRFQFIVMNRRSTNNLVEDLLRDFEYEVQPPYILYRNAAQEVKGIWFYNQNESEEIANLFARILNAFSKFSIKSKVLSSESCFCSTAEVQELETVPTIAVEGALEPPVSVPSLGPGVSESTECLLNNIACLRTSEASVPNVTRLLPPVHPSSVRPSTVTSPMIAPMLPPTSRSSFIPAFNPIVPLLSDTPNLSDTGHTTLVKPSFFVPPPLSSAPTLALPFVPLQPSHGAPFLQPFPPPAPPPSLAPLSGTSQGSLITKDAVRAALFRLVQNDHFIDMVYKELANS